MPPEDQTPPAAVEEADLTQSEENIISLTERAVAKDGTMDMRVIEPGWGSSGFYSEDVLRRDGPTAFPPGTHMHLDHATESERRERPEGSIKDLAAVLISMPAYQENGKVGPGLYARAAVLPTHRETIEALAPYIGVSIRAKGRYEAGEAEGRKGHIIKSITAGESIDFVTKPGAGGKVLALMESLREKRGPDHDHDLSEHSEDNDMELKEAQDRISELEGKLTESDAKLTEASAATATEKVRADRAETALAAVEAQSTARKALENVKLPDASKDRIVESIALNPPLAEGKLDADAVNAKVAESAKTEAEYLERALGTGKVSGMGQASKSDSAEALKESFTKMYLDQGYGSDEAKKLAAIAASGR
jgi:hypothetical protein